MMMVMNIENLWSWIAFLMSICKVVCALGICFNDPLDIVFVRNGFSRFAALD
jgi:hypothetical protein